MGTLWSPFGPFMSDIHILIVREAAWVLWTEYLMQMHARGRGVKILKKIVDVIYGGSLVVVRLRVHVEDECHEDAGQAQGGPYAQRLHLQSTLFATFS